MADYRVRRIANPTIALGDAVRHRRRSFPVLSPAIIELQAAIDPRGADADAGAEWLRHAGVDASYVSVHDRSTHKTAGTDPSAQDRGL